MLSTTIDKYVYISCRYLPPFFEHRLRLAYSQLEDCQSASELKHPAARAVLTSWGINDGVEIHYDGDLPSRSGMGSSSSFTVGLINAVSAYMGKTITERDLAANAIEIEQVVLGERVGSQDQINAAYGGFNHIQFGTDDDIAVSSVKISKKRKDKFNENLMLFYTGIVRTADVIANTYVDDLSSKQTQLNRISDLTTQAQKILVQDDSLDDLGLLLDESWVEKRTLSVSVSNPKIDSLYERAKKNGALGGKITGAGGGGMLLLYVRPDDQEKVKNELSELIYIPFKFSDKGSCIIFVDEQQRYENEEKWRNNSAPKFVELNKLNPT